jgi:hypothetical protein
MRAPGALSCGARALYNGHAARRLLDEARRSLTAGASPEIEHTFKRIDALVRVRSGDKSAIDVMPPPADDYDISDRFTIGWVNLLAGSTEIAAARFKEVMTIAVRLYQ